MLHGWQFLRPQDREAMLRGIVEGRALGGPYHVELDVADVCNADCFFCNSAGFREGAILRWDRLGPLVEEMIESGLRSFRLAGGGEPTIYPDLAPLCERMARAGVILDNITTNAIRLDGARIALLAPLGPTEYSVSLNYVTAERYGRYMQVPANRFDRVVENLELLDSRLREAGWRERTKINLNVFLHHGTVDDMVEAVELAVRLRADNLTLRSVGGLPAEERLTPPDHERLRAEILPAAIEASLERVMILFGLDPDGLQGFCIDTLYRLANERLAGRGDPAISPAPPKPAIGYCYIGWYSLTILGSGKVYPCCFLLPEKSIEPVGDVRAQSLDEVWNGPGFQRFRSEMRAAMLGKPPRGAARHSLPFCWTHHDCVFSHLLADDEFYAAAHEGVAPER